MKSGKKSGKGTGIGLYMTKQIFEKIGASIRVDNYESEIGFGACFTVKI
jgi:signal transduction histidine kinase